MNNFTFFMPTLVLFGSGQLNNLHEQQLPGKKALIITSNGQSAKKQGYLARVEKELEQAGGAHALFDQVRPNPTRENVMEGAKAVKENACDFVVALVGGSVMDCAKCIALMASNPGDIWDYSLSKNGGKKQAQIGGFGKGGRKGFDAIVTRLQMLGYITTVDFEYQQDRYGKLYGWGWPAMRRRSATLVKRFRMRSI